MGSSRCTNEANYLLQKLMRAGLGSNNIDSPARLGFAGARRAFEELLGPGCTANVMDGILNSGAVLVSGGDPTTVNPVLGVRVRGAHMAGSAVITLGHTPGLARHRTFGLAPHPRSEDAALTAILAGLAETGLPDERPELNALIQALAASAPAPDAETASAIKALRAARNVSVVYCPSPVIGGDLRRRVLAVAGIVHALDARLYLLSEGMNKNGLMDAGCLPDELPGGVRLDDARHRTTIEDVWGTPIPTEPGLSLMEAFEAALDGRVKAMYVLGENPSAKLPNSAVVQDALRGLEFLVVQDIFLSETAEKAHVVLPALGWAEKDGTVTNTERRIQLQRTAVAGPGRTDWEILASVGRHLGLRGAYAFASDVFNEMAAVSPLYKGLSHKSIDRDSELWPHHAKEVALHKSEIYGGDSGGLAPLAGAPPHPLLMPMRALINEGSVSRSSEALRSICPPDALHVHEATAGGLGLADGDTVELATASGNMIIKILIDNQIPENVLLVTNMLGGSGLMGLLRYTIDPGTKTPVISDEHAVLKKVN
jgi:predicted molibdopterin-dependent oxidoreductase YjgC